MELNSIKRHKQGVIGGYKHIGIVILLVIALVTVVTIAVMVGPVSHSSDRGTVQLLHRLSFSSIQVYTDDKKRR
jgi:hypothetical protein